MTAEYPHNVFTQFHDYMKILLDITAKGGIENILNQKLWNNNLQDTNNYHGIR
jgi:hypothetical protein